MGITRRGRDAGSDPPDVVAMTERRPARLGALFVLGVPVALAIAACGLFDPFPDLAAAPSDDASVESSTSTTDDSGSSDAAACIVGTTRACGFEACTGTEQCQTDGGWAACNARKPTHELCDTAFDESCDGVGSCTGDGRWARAFGDTRAQEVTAMATDDDGNTYAVGFFDGNLLLNEPDGGAVLNAGDDLERDAFLVKLSRSGALQWARSIPDSRLDAVALRGKEIVVGGTLYASTSLPGCGALTNAGGHDALVARYDPAGNCIKAARYGDDKSQALTALAVDPVNGDIVGVGTYTGELSFGGPADAGSSFPLTYISAGYFVRLDAATLEGRNGTSFRGTRIEVAGVAVTPSQQSIVVGSFFDYFEQHDAKGARDAFVMKIQPGGERYFVGTVGEPNASFALTAVAFDRNRANGSYMMVVAGQLTGHVTLPGGEVLETPSTHGGMFLARIPMAYMATTWTGRWFGDTGLERPYAVATDLEGNVLVAGEVSGHADLGAGAFDVPDFDAFVAKYDPLFAHRWSHVFGGDGHQVSWAVSTDVLGDVFVGGAFAGATDFAEAGAPLEAGVSSDAFVLRRRP